MTFEEKLSQMYNEIANEISEHDTSRMGKGIYDGVYR